MNGPDWLWNYNILQGDFSQFLPIFPMEATNCHHPPTLDPLGDSCGGRISPTSPHYKWIRKIIRLHNQQYPTWRLITTTPLLMYLLDYTPPWTWKNFHLHLHSWRPTETEHKLIFSLFTPFVNMSTGFWLVCIFSKFKCPSSKTYRMKWYLSCICLVFEWKDDFFEI